MDPTVTMSPQLEDKQDWYTTHICNISWQEETPEQLSTSVALPVHGVVPLVKLLVLFLVASISHAPKQVPQGFQAIHEPPTRRTDNKISNMRVDN